MFEIVYGVLFLLLILINYGIFIEHKYRKNNINLKEYNIEENSGKSIISYILINIIILFQNPYLFRYFADYLKFTDSKILIIYVCRQTMYPITLIIFNYLKNFNILIFQNNQILFILLLFSILIIYNYNYFIIQLLFHVILVGISHHIIEVLLKTSKIQCLQRKKVI